MTLQNIRKVACALSLLSALIRGKTKWDLNQSLTESLMVCSIPVFADGAKWDWVKYHWEIPKVALILSWLTLCKPCAGLPPYTQKRIDQVLFKVSWDFFLSDSSTLDGNHSKILNTATDLACLHRLESVQEQQDRWIRCPPGTDQLMAHAQSLLHPYDREDEQTEQTEQNADATWKQLFRAASGTKGKKICTAPAIGNCLSVQQN